MCTRRSAFGNGNGLNRTALATLKMEAFAPIASARVATTVSVKPGVRRRLRAECLKSLTHAPTAFTRHLVGHEHRHCDASHVLTMEGGDSYSVNYSLFDSAIGDENRIRRTGIA